MQEKTTVQREVFARRLRGLAERADLSQAEIARRLKLSPPVVGNWFQGRNLPETTVLPELAAALNVSIDSLFGGYSESPHSLDGVVEEDAQLLAGTPVEALQRKIRAHTESVIQAAGNDVQRLGWIAEQAERYVSAPDSWGSNARVLQAAIEQRKKATQEDREAVGGAPG